MNIRPIRNDEDHTRALAMIDDLWGAADGTPEADTLAVLFTLVDDYESKHHAIDPPFLHMAGTAETLVEQLVPYLALGYRHLIFQFLAPFDHETMERMVFEVKPQLESV